MKRLVLGLCLGVLLVTSIGWMKLPMGREWESVEQFEDKFRGSFHVWQEGACLDIAEMIQNAAYEDGYKVSIGFAFNGTYYGQYVTDARGYHAGVVIRAGEHYYFIDPEPWKVTRLF